MEADVRDEDGEKYVISLESKDKEHETENSEPGTKMHCQVLSEEVRAK